MQILMIDNYDSFTYNLVQYFQELDAEVKTVRNNDESVESLMATAPQAVVLSPGPSEPKNAGICIPLAKKCIETRVPLLGVCLGHQVIGEALGGKVVRTTPAVHGKTTNIYHESSALFKDIPSPFTATRYHSLVLEASSLPSSLEVTAKMDDGMIMGIAHRKRPAFGVQFHPESILTTEGRKLLQNFLNILG